MKTILSHFYYASAAGTAAGVAAYHVAVLDVAETMEDVAALGGQAQRERTLTADQAAAEGVTLDVIAEAFTSDLVAENAMLRKAVEAATAAVAEMADNVARVTEASRA